MTQTIIEQTTATNYRKSTLSFRLGRLLLKTIVHALFKIEVQGLENLPKEGGYILAGNHLSWIDPFLMLTEMPVEPRIYFIAAREDVESPPHRKFFTEHIGGVIPVDRGSAGAYRDIVNRVNQVLQAGGVLGLFPEGDVSAIETGKILPLKKGIGHFAAQSGLPVVPVGFSGTKELWLRKRVRMRVGEPLEGAKGGRAVAQSQTEKTAEALRQLLPSPVPADPKSLKLFKKFFTGLFTQEVKEHPIPD